MGFPYHRWLAINWETEDWNNTTIILSVIRIWYVVWIATTLIIQLYVRVKIVPHVENTYMTVSSLYKLWSINLVLVHHFVSKYLY